ncbi:hypothetical protein ES703_32296 [subsurface metagenome]
MIIDNKDMEAAAKKIVGGQKTGFRRIQLTELEALYITQKILGVKSLLPVELNRELGTSVLKKIWGDNIQGDSKKVKW